MLIKIYRSDCKIKAFNFNNATHQILRSSFCILRSFQQLIKRLLIFLFNIFLEFFENSFAY